MIISGVDWHVIAEIKKFVEPKLATGQTLEVDEDRRERETDMWGHMEYWGELKIKVLDSAGKVIHRKTVRSSHNGSGLPDRYTDREQYSYRVNTDAFEAWFITPQ